MPTSTGRSSGRARKLPPATWLQRSERPAGRPDHTSISRFTAVGKRSIPLGFSGGTRRRSPFRCGSPGDAEESEVALLRRGPAKGSAIIGRYPDRARPWGVKETRHEDHETTGSGRG